MRPLSSSSKRARSSFYCLSKSQIAEMRERFNVVACVEIIDAKAFCRRVEKALPWRAAFGGRPGHQRIGHHVDYYKVTNDPNLRWACPDLIASSKLDTYRWQDEYRLVFSLTDALRFENIAGRIVQGEVRSRTATSSEHHHYDVRLGDLNDIAVLHELPAAVPAASCSRDMCSESEAADNKGVNLAKQEPEASA